MIDNHEPDLQFFGSVESQRIARVYAEALSNAAEKQQQVDAVLEEMDCVVRQVFKADPQFEEFLASGAVGRDRKAVVIQKVFEPRASELFVNFLLVLNRHERLDLLRQVLAAARNLFNERRRRVRVQVLSAVPLPEDQCDRLRKELRESLQREPLLDKRVDPDLLGGMVVRVDDWLFDASVRTQLQTIRNQLIEKSTHEIQSRRDRFRTADGN